MTDDEMREALGEAMLARPEIPFIVAAVLPVVRRIAAEELRAAARDLAGVPGNPYPLVVTEFLSDRADYLYPPDAA